MEKIRRSIAKLPILLLIAISVNVVMAGGAFGDIFWTNTSNAKFTTLSMSEGEIQTIRVRADVPAGKTLKAFTFNINYPGDKFQVLSVNKDSSDLSNVGEIIINPDPEEANNYPSSSGKIRVTGFDTIGVTGGAGVAVSLIDITVKGITQVVSGEFAIEVVDFGEDAANPIAVTSQKAAITVTSIASTEAKVYWTDTLGTQLDSIDMFIGQKKVIRLKAQIPEGKTLGAFKFTLPYTNAAIISVVDAVASIDSPIKHEYENTKFPSVNINNDTLAGKIIATGFTTQGIPGSDTISFIDVEIEAIDEGTSIFSIDVNNFGVSEGVEFKPLVTTPLTIKISKIIENENHQAYWTDAGGTKLTALTVPQGGTAFARLMATVPEGKTLGAYKFTLTYNSDFVDAAVVKTPNAAFPPNNINTATPGQIVINGFDTIGFKGSDVLAFIDVTMTWKAGGDFKLGIDPNNYGASATDEFLPAPVPLDVTVSPVVPPEPPVTTTYTVNFTAGENGLLEGNLIQTINSGSNTSAVTAVPNTGFAFLNWVDANGNIIGTENPLTINSVTSNMEITANFVEEFTVTFTAGANGSLEGTAVQTVAKGGSTTAVTAQPADGFRFLNWTGDYQSSDNPLVVNNVTSNMTITANFVDQDMNIVNFTAGPNGSVQGELSQAVELNGSTTAVTALADENYIFENWTGTGGFSSTDNPLIIDSVLSDMDITANFTAKPGTFFTITFKAGEHGSIIGNLIQNVEAGQSTTAVTAIPDYDYKLDTWTDAAGNIIGTTDSLTLNNVNAEMVITANFKVKAVDPDAPAKPVLTLPANGAKNVVFRPELKAGNYASPVGQAHGWTIWEVSTDNGFGETGLVYRIKTNADPNLDFSSLTLPDFILTEKGKTYYWRARYVDILNRESEWSDISQFTTAVENAEYQDGVPVAQTITADVLKAIFSASDMNGALFVKVLSGNGVIGIKGVENVEEIEWLKWISGSDLPVSELGNNLIFPKGFVTYKLKAKKPGDTVKIKLMIETDIIPSNAVWYAYNLIEGWDIVKVATASNRKYVTFQIQDGGFGDADGVRNGWIVDPIGYAVAKIPSCPDCDPEIIETGGGGSDTCFINTVSYGSSGLILMVMTFISAVSVFFGRKK
ncbi:immunoglobulin-like fold-containing [Desulfonema limicola]|uniref:Immunoglobulin-like fold-containing n=1 Tax=Desulfonema limicola TaxID=45656 RepID=A0A975B4D1_9BACT|nr:choice-of-anchor U domain-containing protein [Desulfonema limicola]QTA78558.1 immunoglobulin-like fold-containing [Desulfonema limicola]